MLGAGVNWHEPSLSLKTRLEAALDYLEDHGPDVPVVLTGGQGYGEEITRGPVHVQLADGAGGGPATG